MDATARTRTMTAVTSHTGPGAPEVICHTDPADRKPRKADAGRWKVVAASVAALALAETLLALVAGQLS